MPRRGPWRTWRIRPAGEGVFQGSDGHTKRICPPIHRHHLGCRQAHRDGDRLTLIRLADGGSFQQLGEECEQHVVGAPVMRWPDVQDAASDEGALGGIRNKRYQERLDPRGLDER